MTGSKGQRPTPEIAAERRAIALRLLEQGIPARVIAQQLHVSSEWVHNLRRGARPPEETT